MSGPYTSAIWSCCPPTPGQEQELLRLRKEVDALRGEATTKPSLYKDSRA
ncbi:hypothetical protein ABZ498_01130 [Streptomyces lavendulocolor]